MNTFRTNHGSLGYLTLHNNTNTTCKCNYLYHYFYTYYSNESIARATIIGHICKPIWLIIKSAHIRFDRGFLSYAQEYKVHRRERMFLSIASVYIMNISRMHSPKSTPSLDSPAISLETTRPGGESETRNRHVCICN